MPRKRYNNIKKYGQLGKVIASTFSIGFESNQLRHFHLSPHCLLAT